MKLRDLPPRMVYLLGEEPMSEAQRRLNQSMSNKRWRQNNRAQKNAIDRARWRKEKYG